MDPWIITPVERARHVEQFKGLNPIGGFVTGDQAKNFLLQSQLPPAVLGLIWSLADVNCDGKMDINEFSVACKLITMKLRGFEIPPTLPPALRMIIATGSNTVTPVISPSSSLTGLTSPTGSAVMASSSIPTSGRATPSKAEDPWAILPQERARHLEQFNGLNPVNGFLTGDRIKAFMVQSQLAPSTLGIIWNLADINCDGKMDINEFSVACKLITMKLRGFEIPHTLPSVLKAIFTPTTSASTTPILQSPTSSGPSFEDKRKENYEKSRLELERRRKVLQDMQNREREERERKEREENEKRESENRKIRQELERKKQEEMEMKLAMQREMEERKMEELRKTEEMKENARKEMERQRMNEMQEAKRNELLTRRVKEQEHLLKLKSENANIGLELQGLTEKVKELGVKITETRVGVSGVKSEIDGMRVKRDDYISEVTALKVKLKDQNARVLAAEKEKVRLDKLLVERDVKSINLKQLREKLVTMKEELAKKQKDSELQTDELTELKTTLSTLIESCKTVYEDYKEKRTKILSMRKKHHQEFDYNAAWSTTSHTTAYVPDEQPLSYYRALYDFESRNPDELSFVAGEIIQKNPDIVPDPGWLAGIIDGRSGWFPEAFVEEYTDDGGDHYAAAEPIQSNDDVVIAPSSTEYAGEGEYYVAMFPYESAEPGDLAFQVGETILVTHAEGEWWTGSIGDRVGIFPGNYVSKSDDKHSEVPTSFQPEGEQVDEEVCKVGDNIVGEQSKNELEPYEEAEIKREMSEITKQTVVKSPKPVKSSGKRYEIATVLANYQPSSSGSGQLTLTRGMLVTVRKKPSSGWWEGELQAKGKKREIGWFPGSYVKILGPGGGGSRGGSSRTTPIPFDDDMPEDIAPVFYSNDGGDQYGGERSSSAIAGEQVIALYPYTAQNSDELTFVKDDVITIISKDEPDWWRGQLRTAIGLFPTNYIEPMQLNQDYTDFDNFQTPSQPEPYHQQQQPEIYKTYQHQSHPIVPFNEPIVGEDANLRQEAIRELVATEETYLKDMIVVKECFISPLLASTLLSQDECNSIFVNWDDLIDCSNKLLMAFKVRWRSFGRIQIVGDILIQQLPSMQIYIRFCSTNQKAGALLQSKLTSSTAFSNYLKKLSLNPKTQKLTLGSYLLKPMQRITKYPLLIQKILQATNKDHPDRRNLEEAQIKAEELCKLINEGVRETENSDCLEWIQQNLIFDLQEERIVFNSMTNCVGARKCLHYGVFKKVKSGKELVGFLFNDFLLLTLPTKSISQINFNFSERNSSSLRFKIYRKPIFLNEITFTDMEETEFMVGSMLLAALGISEKILWLKKLQEGKKSYEKIEKQFKSNQRSNKMVAMGRLLVVVVEGHDLLNVNVGQGNGTVYGTTVVGQLRVTLIQGSFSSVKRNHIHGKSDPYCEVSLGNEVKRTRVLKETLNPKWNDSMQFTVRDLVGDIVSISVYDKDFFSPNQFMGRTEIGIAAIHEEMKSRKTPWTRKFKLQEVESGEVVIKFHLQVFND